MLVTLRLTNPCGLNLALKSPAILMSRHLFQIVNAMVQNTPVFALIEVLQLATGLYLAAGACFAMFFAAWGAQTIDSAAEGMPLLARLLLLPGATALWPLLLVRWLRRRSPPVA